MTDSQQLRSFGPRSMYYSARDLRLINPAASLPALVKEQSARQHLVNEAVRASELLINSVRSIKPFDEMGNVELTVPQIEEARNNALLKVNNLLESIAKTNERVSSYLNSEYTPRPSYSIWPPDQTISGEEALPPATIGFIQSRDVEVVESPRTPTPADVAAFRGPQA